MPRKEHYLEHLKVETSWLGDKAEIVQLIRTTLTRRGKGTEEAPIRIITQYWEMDGTLLFEFDPLVKKVRDDLANN